MKALLGVRFEDRSQKTTMECLVPPYGTEAAGRTLYRRRVPLWRRGLLATLRVRVIYGEAAWAIERADAPLVCANHQSLLDGVLIGLASPRPLVFPVNRHHARAHPLTRRLLAWLERRGLGRVVPLDAGAPHGMRTLAQALGRGEPVCIFPEGRLPDEPGASEPEQPGTAWLQAGFVAQFGLRSRLP